MVPDIRAAELSVTQRFKHVEMTAKGVVILKEGPDLVPMEPKVSGTSRLVSTDYEPQGSRATNVRRSGSVWVQV